MTTPRVLVLGAGYAGFTAAKVIARRSSAAVTLVNERDHFQERMRNHQVAVGRARPARRLSDMVGRDRIDLIVDRVVAIDLDAKQVVVAGQDAPIPYDVLVYALGSIADLGAVPGAAEHATAVATLEQSAELHDRLDRASSIVVVGGGLTGIETVTELAAARPDAAVHLIAKEAPGQVLNERGQAYLAEAFERLGVAVRTGVAVTKVGPDSVLLDDGDVLDADLVVWTGGFSVPPLAGDSGLAVDDHGRVLVDPTLRSLSHPDVYCVGDAAAARNQHDDLLRMGCGPGGVAAAVGAMAVVDRLGGEEPRPLHFQDAAWHVTLGPKDGIVQLGLGEDARLITGRPAAFIKEQVLRGARWGQKHPGLAVQAARRF